MKSKHRRYTPGRQQAFVPKKLHTMAFTIEALTTLQGSFKTMEEVFQRNFAMPNPKMPFAFETFQSVKQKVADMLQAPGMSVALDANEIVIIRACLQIYVVDLLCMKETPERNVIVATCHQVAALLPQVPYVQTRTHD